MRNEARHTVLFGPREINDPVEVELVRQVDTLGIGVLLLEKFGGERGLPEHLLTRLRDQNALLSEIEPIPGMRKESDSLWWARRAWGPLLGDEGVVLVRAGRPIAYVILINH